MIGYSRGLAMLFVEYLKVFGASTAKTTLLMGVNAGFYSFGGVYIYGNTHIHPKYLIQ